MLYVCVVRFDMMKSFLVSNITKQGLKRLTTNNFSGCGEKDQDSGLTAE